MGEALDGQRGDAGGLQLLDGALDVKRIAVAVIGIDQERQRAGPADAIGLAGKLGQRQQDQIRSAQHGEGCDRAGEHAGLEAQVLGDAGRQRVEHRGRMDAVRLPELGPEALASFAPMHGDSPLLPGAG